MQQPDRSALPEALQNLLGSFDQLKFLRSQQNFEHTTTNVREALEVMTRRFVSSAPDMVQIRDAMIADAAERKPAVSVRIYIPDTGQPLPVLVFAHGGGHMAGSVSVYEMIARKLASASAHILVSVDYRLTPECRYPSGLEDLETVLENVLPALSERGIRHNGELSLAGDSAGGALSASAMQRLGLAGQVKLENLVLIYPSLDYTMSHASIDELAEGFLLEKERIEWLVDHYFESGQDRGAASALQMPIPDHCPQVLVVTAQYCPLRDEGMAYAERLRNAGVDVQNLHFDDMIHAFLNLDDLVPQQCERFYNEVGRFLGNVNHA